VRELLKGFPILKFFHQYKNGASKHMQVVWVDLISFTDEKFNGLFCCPLPGEFFGYFRLKKISLYNTQIYGTTQKSFKKDSLYVLTRPLLVFDDGTISFASIVICIWIVCPPLQIHLHGHGPQHGFNFGTDVPHHLQEHQDIWRLNLHMVLQKVFSDRLSSSCLRVSSTTNHGFHALLAIFEPSIAGPKCR
jgi:hypothetical protein